MLKRPLSVVPPEYYDRSRPDLVDALPRPLGRVLDVGCGRGAVGRRLRAEGATRVVGIEVNPEEGAAAVPHYDRVLFGSAEDLLEGLAEEFDTICCFDVLEHLIDPYSVLRQLRALAAGDGVLSVSVPNARHWSLQRDLALRGTFGYTAFGHRDRTHLRWFSPRDIVEAVADGGWVVTKSSYPRTGRSGILDRLSLGAFSQFLATQWYVLAATRPPRPTRSQGDWAPREIS